MSESGIFAEFGIKASALQGWSLKMEANCDCTKSPGEGLDKQTIW